MIESLSSSKICVGNEQFSQVYNENMLALHDKKKMLVI